MDHTANFAPAAGAAVFPLSPRGTSGERVGEGFYCSASTPSTEYHLKAAARPRKFPARNTFQACRLKVGVTADWKVCATVVAQVFNLLYRRLLVCRAQAIKFRIAGVLPWRRVTHFDT